MTLISSGQKTRIIKVPGKLKKAPSQRLLWPRCADDNKTPLGVDVNAKRQDIIKIVHKFFKVIGIPMEELLQEVYLAIIHKNYSKSAHDPRKSSFGHYVYMIANNVCVNLVHKKKRYDRERDSIDSQMHPDDERSILDTVEMEEVESDDIDDQMEEAEQIFRKRGSWEVARYIRAIRCGVSPDVIREALSWGSRKISNKHIRDIRLQIRNALPNLAVFS